MQHADVLEQLRQCEARFHRPQLGATDTELEAMLSATFFEVGASGKRFGRTEALAVLQQRAATPPETARLVSDDECRQLGSDVYLFTYTLREAERTSFRATVWQRKGEGWVAQFHQGTLVP